MIIFMDLPEELFDCINYIVELKLHIVIIFAEEVRLYEAVKVLSIA